MGSHILTWTICFDTLTNHAICNIIWGVIAMFLFWASDLPRTLKAIGWMSIVSSVSVAIAVFITMIALIITKPSTGLTGDNPYHLFPVEKPPFQKVFVSVLNIVFAYAGHAAFFSFMSELKDPNEFNKSLALLQVSEISLYSVTATIIYAFAGKHVASPALNSAGSVVQKVSYAIALPTVSSKSPLPVLFFPAD